MTNPLKCLASAGVPTVHDARGSSILSPGLPIHNGQPGGGEAELHDKIRLLQIHAGKTVPAPDQHTGASPKAKMDPPRVHAGSDVQTLD